MRNRPIAERRAQVIAVTPSLQERAHAKVVALLDAVVAVLVVREIPEPTARLAAQLRPALLAAMLLLVLYPLASWLHELPATYRASHDGSGQAGQFLISSRSCSKYGCVWRGTFTGTDGAVRANVRYRDAPPGGTKVGDTLTGRYIPEYGVLATGDSTFWRQGSYLAIISTSFLGLLVALSIRGRAARVLTRPKCPVCGARIVGGRRRL